MATIVGFVNNGQIVVVECFVAALVVAVVIVIACGGCHGFCAENERLFRVAFELLQMRLQAECRLIEFLQHNATGRWGLLLLWMLFRRLVVVVAVVVVVVMVSSGGKLFGIGRRHHGDCVSTERGSEFVLKYFHSDLHVLARGSNVGVRDLARVIEIGQRGTALENLQQKLEWGISFQQGRVIVGTP